MKTKMALVGLMTALAACASPAPQPMYAWGSYSPALLSYYKKPGELAQFAEHLQVSLAVAEAANKVPPGLYAEVGYVMLEMGKRDEAITFFGKERDRWPESGALMTKLITRLGGQPPAATPATAPTSPIM
jgi:hypothetical protein